MSTPIVGSITRRQERAAAAEQSETDRRKRQKAKTAAAEAHSRERINRLEEARREAYRKTMERAGRRLILEQQRESELRAAEARRVEERERAISARIRNLRDSAAAIEVSRSSGASDPGVEAGAGAFVVGETPPASTVADLEAWAAAKEKEHAEWLARRARAAIEAAVNMGHSALIGGICQGVASQARTGAAVMVAFDLAVSAQDEGDLKSEMRRARSQFTPYQNLIFDPTVSAKTSQAMTDALSTLAACRDHSALRATVQSALGLFAAARREAEFHRSLALRIRTVETSWMALPVAVPAALSAMTSQDDPLTEESVAQWEREYEAVAAIERERDRELDRELVASSVQLALENLGYEVEGIGNTALFRGGRIYATKPGWRGHFVELSGSQGGNGERLAARCVRLPASIYSAGANEDKACEKEFCDDLHKAMAELSEQGIDYAIDTFDKTAPAVVALSDEDMGSSSLAQRKASGLAAQQNVRRRELKS